MMRLPKFEHAYPLKIEEVSLLLEKYGPKASILAGGTDLLVACKLRIAKPSCLISLQGIEELKGIIFNEGEGLKIGAMTNLSKIRFHPFICEHYPALSQAASSVGTPQLQEMGTLGGNLCLNTRCIYYNQSESWRKVRAQCLKMDGDVCHVVPKGKKCYAVFSGDMSPALISLNAKVRLVKNLEDRLIPLSHLYTGDGKEPIALKRGELLTEIIIPSPTKRQSSTYLKYRMRGAIDFPLTGVAVQMGLDKKGICTDCRIALTGVDSAPIDVSEAGELLRGKAIDVEWVHQASQKAVEKAHPVSNTSCSTPAYRRKMVGILTKQALISVAKNLGMIQ
jgi:4-hydroxybenzoyl-CoA reductase subunit beta